ncbi:IniB N-terminal domain-containing protein [Gordonia insulae]|uniref:Uncharacterized protein n=1 Tax=Gordonia insulae TaxID=2420509 RepID=A0A3G8JHH9_9ACTN|nr:IniB N-terminal domain-containing protein [Gordonia insulae]AZG44547.1 hypothetical protein D7316_01133 [Gordonia insulae]
MPRPTLLEFVTALAHDPAFAAAYWADPAETLRDANLHDVSAADISALMPMAGGADAGGLSTVGDNVWRGSEALLAFDVVSDDAVPIATGQFSDPAGLDFAHSAPEPLDTCEFDCVQTLSDLYSAIEVDAAVHVDTDLTAQIDAVDDVRQHPCAGWSTADPGDQAGDLY